VARLLLDAAAGRVCTNRAAHAQPATLLAEEDAMIEGFDLPHDRGPASVLHREIAGLLADLVVWVGRTSDELKPARCEREEEERIDPLSPSVSTVKKSQASVLAACWRRNDTTTAVGARARVEFQAAASTLRTSSVRLQVRGA
jgi:hypothetical protein